MKRKNKYFKISGSTPQGMAVVNWLRERRESIPRSLRVAARIAKCSDSWLNQIETGWINIYSVKVSSLDKIAAAYNISVPQLLTMLGVIPYPVYSPFGYSKKL